MQTEIKQPTEATTSLPPALLDKEYQKRLLYDFCGTSYMPFMYPTKLEEQLVSNTNPMFVKTLGAGFLLVEIPMKQRCPSKGEWLLASLLSKSFENVTIAASQVDSFFNLPPSARTLAELRGVSYDSAKKYAAVPGQVLQKIFAAEIESLEERVADLKADQLFLSANPDEVRLWHLQRVRYLEKLRERLEAHKKPESDEDQRSSTTRRENFNRAIECHRNAFSEKEDAVVLAERDKTFRDIVSALLHEKSDLDWPRQSQTQKSEMETLFRESRDFSDSVLNTYRGSVQAWLEQYRRAQATVMILRDTPEDFRSDINIARLFRSVARNTQFAHQRGMGIDRGWSKALIEMYHLKSHMRVGEGD